MPVVKFAQGARRPTSGVAAVEGLDLFYLPTYSLNLEITSFKYNRANGQLEVTYRNNADIVTYLKGTITLTSDTGDSKRVGDIEPVFIEANDVKTIVYPDIGINGESFTAKVFTIFGESKKSLEYAIDATYKVEVVNIIDKCEVELKRTIYHMAKKMFYIEVANTGQYDCYVDSEIIDVLIADEPTTLGFEGTMSLKVGETKQMAIPAELTDYDIGKNRFINVIAYYGERSDSLTKMVKGKIELLLKKLDVVFYGALVTVVVLILILFFIVIKRRRKDEEEEEES